MSDQSISANKGYISLSVIVQIFKEGDSFVAYCFALQLSSYGNTKSEAKKLFKEALDIFLNETQKRGTLEKYLLKMGWVLQQQPKPVYTQPVPPMKTPTHLLSHYNQRVAIPI